MNIIAILGIITFGLSAYFDYRSGVKLLNNGWAAGALTWLIFVVHLLLFH